MVKSMTGYGRARATRNLRDITVEVRSVNNRYLDCTVKMPRTYAFAEAAVKGRVQKAVSRGKVDVFITVDATAADTVQVSVNTALAAQYAEALKALAAVCGTEERVTPEQLARFPDVLTVTKAEEDLETVRLRSHVEQLRGMLQREKPTGKDMDFLMQEFNRESNTIGSKCSDLAISEVVVALKGEVEKIREQVQNIE